MISKVYKEIITCGAVLHAEGLVSGAAGNISVRLKPGVLEKTSLGGMVITGGGTELGALSPEGLVIVLDTGERWHPDGSGSFARPSSELPMHSAIYAARPDVQAVIHLHSPHATALAACHLDIPAFLDELTYLIGGPVQVSQYAYPGSPELGAAVVAALGDHQAALIANHGAVAVGSGLDECIKVIRIVEEAAMVYLLARSAGGPKPIPAEALERQMAAFRQRREAKNASR